MSQAASDPVVRSAARWFWWIAGLSLVNMVLFYSGSQTTFVIGLAMTTMASVILAGSLPLAIGLAALTIAFYFAMGFYAQQQRLWAFYLGLAVYVLDGLIYVFFQDWMPVAFHALAAFFIFKGIARVRALAASPQAPPAG